MGEAQALADRLDAANSRVCLNVLVCCAAGGRGVMVGVGMRMLSAWQRERVPNRLGKNRSRSSARGVHQRGWDNCQSACLNRGW